MQQPIFTDTRELGDRNADSWRESVWEYAGSWNLDEHKSDFAGDFTLQNDIGSFDFVNLASVDAVLTNNSTNGDSALSDGLFEFGRSVNPDSGNDSNLQSIDEIVTSPQNSEPSKKRSRRNSDSNNSKKLVPCPECGRLFKRPVDAKRHVNTVHYPSKFDCQFENCYRQGAYGFNRRDHYREHLREIHKVENFSKKRKQSQ